MWRIILLFLMVSPFSMLAQKKKDLYIQMDSLVRGGKFAQGRPMARQVLKEYPDNAYTTYLLGKTYQQEAMSLYLHHTDKLAVLHDSTQSIYERAKALVDKKDLRKNKDFYEAIFGTKEFLIEDVTGMIDRDIESLDAYFARQAMVKLRLRNLQDLYANSEEQFVQLMKQHPNFDDFYLTYTAEKEGVLKALQTRQPELVQAVKEYEALFVGDSVFKDLHYQAFSFIPVENNIAYHVQESDFIKRQLKLYDFGAWAQAVQERAQQYQQLKAKLLALEQKIAQQLAQHAANADSTAFAKEAQQLIQPLMLFEGKQPWPPLLDYQLEKLAYYKVEEKVRKTIEEGAFFDLEEKGKMIAPLVARLLRMRTSASALPEGKMAFARHQQILATFLGDAPDMETYKAAQEQFVEQQLMYWNTARAASIDIPDYLPDELAFKDKHILLRASKYSLSAGLEKGYYMTEKIQFLPDSSFIVNGKYGKEGACFLAKVSKEGVVTWLRTDLDALEKTVSIDHIMSFGKAGIMYLSKRARAGVTRVVMEVIDQEAGLPSSSRVLRAMPEQVFAAPDAPGVFFLHVKNQDAGGFKEIEVEGYKFGQERGVFLRFLLRGDIVAVLPQAKRFRLVANFQEYQDLDGNFAESKAYKVKGFNVVVATVPLDGKPAVLTPVFSMTPILAQEASSEADGKVWINGLQGDYIFISPKEVSGGKPWQKYVD